MVRKLGGESLVVSELGGVRGELGGESSVVRAWWRERRAWWRESMVA